MAKLTTICSDKTGTLTINKLVVSSLWYNGQIAKVNRGRHDATAFNQYDINDAAFKRLQEGALVSTKTTFDR
jgi:magnesium-transporting ATPase (P-type)